MIDLTTEALPTEVIDMALQDVLGVQVTTRQSVLVISRIQSDGAFARNGLKTGDQLLAVNGQRLNNIEDLRTILSNAKSDHKGTAVFTIRRGRYQGQVEMPI
jgi:S1-C subfamily serine protease